MGLRFPGGGTVKRYGQRYAARGGSRTVALAAVLALALRPGAVRAETGDQAGDQAGAAPDATALVRPDARPGARSSARANDLPEQALAEYLFGVPEGLDYRALVNKPTVLGTTHYVFTDDASGETRLAGYIEVVAVYDLPLEALWAVLLDYPAYPSYSPRILGTVVEHTDGPTSRLRYTTGIRFLGIEVSYEALEDVTAAVFDDGSKGLRTRLFRSLDDSVFEHFSSFYLAPVLVDGRTMTLARYFSRPGIRNPSPGMLQVLRLFAAPEGRSQMAAVARETERRLGRR